MKRWFVLVVVGLLLSGCAAEGTFETLGDPYELHEDAIKQEIVCILPQEASAQTVQSDYGQLYFCDGYEIALQTFEAGDLDRTLRQLTGFGAEDITVIETGLTPAARYDFVWTAAGEGGDMVCRATVLDDGNYHYCMSVMASQADAPRLREAWKALFDSFTLG